jgi:parallel beta-helix repeat protein
MVFKKYHYRNGKKFGPYYYQSYRDKDGKVKRTYLGTENPSTKKTFLPTNRFNTFLIILMFLFVLLGLFVVLSNFGISGKIISTENVEKSFEGVSSNLEIKEPTKILGQPVADNKNKRMDFSLPNGKIRLYFDLLDYSAFVENVAQLETNPVESENPPESIGISAMAVEESNEIENSTDVSNSSTSKPEIFVNVSNLDGTQLDKAISNSIVPAEAFDIIVNEAKLNEKKPQYKWGYKVKLNDLNFLAKVDITSDLKIARYNDNTLRIGNSLLSFADLEKQGYKVRIEVPALEISTNLTSQIENSSLNITLSNQTISNLTNESLEIPPNTTTLNETTPSINETSQETNETTPSINETSQETNETIPSEDNNPPTIENPPQTEQAPSEEQPVPPTQDNSENENTQTNSEPQASQADSDSEQTSPPEQQTGITGGVIKTLAGITAKVIEEIANSENLGEDLEYTNSITIYIERDFTENSEGINLGDIIELDPTLEIIEISKAEHLDENKSFISDIYDYVKALDENWSETIPENDYVRVTFEFPLDNTRDITLYPRTVNGTPKIEVYEIDKNETIATFENLTDSSYNKIYLTLLNGTQDTFDLKILNGSIELDHIIDPAGSMIITLNSPGNYSTGNSLSPKLNVSVNNSLANTMNVTFWNKMNSISTGNTHTCGIISNGSAMCWGLSGNGQLGYGGTSSQNNSVYVNTTNTFVAISAGSAHTCGVIPNGSAMCWGAGTQGQLGYGGTTQQNNPIYVNITNLFVAISAETFSGAGSHSCGITSDGRAMCWGYGFNGQLGIGNTSNSRVPIYVNTTNLFFAISASGSRSCGIISNGSAMCWGMGTSGRLGYGGTTQQNNPIYVNTSNTFVAISAGSAHTCGIISNGSAMCWGLGTSGQLGNGPGTSSNNPVYVNTTNTFISISAGNLHTCGIISNGSAMCWGNGTAGQLGDGGTANQNNSVYVNTTNTFISISAGNLHTCGIISNGSAMCWGNGTSGQLGDGPGLGSSNPVYVNTTNLFPNETINVGNNSNVASGSSTTITWSGLRSNSTYLWSTTANDGAGILHSLIWVFTTGSAPDTIYPNFSNYWDNNATLVGSGIALFNATIANTNGTVFLQINGTNYTATNLTADVYNVSASLTSNGTYNYYWGAWGNGTSHNYNTSGTRSYTVNTTVVTGDTTPPSINFTAPTPSSGSTQSGNSIYVNVTSNDSNQHYTFADFDRDLVLWMRMDDVNGSGDPTDLSSYSNNGSKQGDTVINSSSGYFGNGSWFGGAGDINISDSDSLDFYSTNAYTWSFWLNHRNSFIGFMSKYSGSCGSGASGYSMGLGDDPNVCFTECNTGTGLCADTINDNQWYHIAIVYNNSDTKIYFNGVLNNSGTVTFTNDDTTSPLLLGAGFGEGGDTTLIGNLDEVLIFNRSLSAAEIQSLYNASAYKYYNNFTDLTDGTDTFTGYAVDIIGNKNQTEQRSVTINANPPNVDFIGPTPPNGSTQAATSIFVNVSSNDASQHYSFTDFDRSNVLWMRMDEVNSSGSPTDISSYSNNGTTIGNAIQNDSGMFGKGFSFDGNAAVVAPTTGFSFGSSPRTITAWVRPTSDDSSSWGQIVHYGFGDCDGLMFGLGRLDGYLVFWGGCVDYSSTLSIPLNQWSFIAVTYDGTFVNLYRNLENGSAEVGALDTQSSNLHIGAETVDNGEEYRAYFNGSIDEVLIFNRSLSAAEIQSLYNASAYQYSRNFTNLAGGPHTFTGYAVDIAGNKNQTEQRTITLETGTNATICRTLNQPNTVYTLQSSVIATIDFNCFNITANNVTLDLNGFNVTSAYMGGTTPGSAVLIEGYNYTTIKNGLLYNFGTGISGNNVYVSNFTNLTITSSSATSLSGGDANLYGVYLSGDRNSISNSNISSNDIYLAVQSFGVSVSGSNNTVRDNFISDSTGRWAYGVYLFGFNNGLISNNIINHDNGTLAGDGLYLFSSSNNSIVNNSFSQNYHGIYVDGDTSRGDVSLNNSIINTTSSSNDYSGVYITSDAYYNTIQGGTIISPIYIFGANNIVNGVSMAGNRIYSNAVNTTITNNYLSNAPGSFACGFDQVCQGDCPPDPPGYRAFIELDMAHNSLVVNNTIGYSSFSRYGIFINQTNNTIAENNTVLSLCGDEIYLLSSYFNNLTNNIANSSVLTTTSGFLIQGSNNNILQNNVAKGNKIDGIKLSSSSYNIFTNNTANSNTKSGFNLTSSSNNIFTNNTARSNTIHGVSIGPSSSNNTFNNNTFVASTQYGVYVLSSSNNSFNNNTINSSSSYGTSFVSSPTNFITGGSVKSGTSYSIYIDANSQNIVIDGIQINASSGTRGVYSLAGNTTVKNSNIRTSSSGYNIYLSGASNSTVLNNLLYSASYGLYLDSSTRETLVANNTFNTNLYGLYLTSVNNNTFINNTFNSHTRDSIYLTSANGNNFTDTYIWNCSGTAYRCVYLTGSKNNTFTGGIVNLSASILIYLTTNSNNNTFQNMQLVNSTSSSIYLTSSSNNTFSNVNISDSQSHAVQLVSSAMQNTFTNLIINNTALVAVNVSVNNNRINSFVNNTFYNTPWDYYLSNSTISPYGFNGSSIEFTNDLGGIKFLNTTIFAWGNNLSDVIFIGNNSVTVLSNISSAFNVSANITIYNSPGTGFVNPIILKDGIACNLSCYNFTALNAATVIFNVTSWTNYSIGEGPDIIFPLINMTYPRNTSYNVAVTVLNYTVSDTNLQACWYNVGGNGPTNITISPCGKNVSGLTSSQGSNTWIVYANDSAGNVNFSSRTFFVDSINPSISALNESPVDPANYTLSGIYQFNATITDANLQNVIIEFNGTNHTPTANAGGVYNFTISNLAVGTYFYYWRANDSLGNVNLTQLQNFTINKALSEINLTLNNTAGNITIRANSSIYLNATRASGEGDVLLYLNGTLINQGQPTIGNWSNFSEIGLFNITALYPETQNYSASVKIYFVNVTEQAISIAISFSPKLLQVITWNLASLPAYNISADGNNATGFTEYWINLSVTGGTADLYMKATDLVSSGGSILGVGNETFSYNSTNASVPSDVKSSFTLDYSNNKIGDGLADGSAVYLKFFLNAPSAQSAGTYNNTLDIKAVPHGETP